MRVGRRSIFGLLVAAGMLLPPAHVGAGTSDASTLTVTKAFVDGAPAPDGVAFEIQVHCQSGEAAGAEGGATTQTLTFGSTGGAQTIDVPSSLDFCIVTETDDGGAVTATYGSPSSGGGCDYSTNGLQGIGIELGSGAACAVTVTNVFPLSEPPPPSAPPATAPPTPVPPAAVRQQPAFTG